jgi:small membrane protein
MIFQIAVLTYVALTCWRITVDWRKRRISYRFFWLILLTHLPLIPITLQPEITSRVAHYAGIGRGADFVIYCAILLIGRLLLAFYRWNIRLESEITQLVRQFALSETYPLTSRGRRVGQSLSDDGPESRV